MSKQLADQILALDGLYEPSYTYDASLAFERGVTRTKQAAASLAANFRSARPWQATAEEIAEHGAENADYAAWSEWIASRINAQESGAYPVSCIVADAILPPPTFRHRVALDQIAEWIANWHEPTAEEVQALFRPKVRALGEWKWEEHHNAWVAMLGEDIEYWVQPENGFFRWHCMWQSQGEGECDTLELAQAAAQAHWEARAEAFWREAFE